MKRLALTALLVALASGSVDAQRSSDVPVMKMMKMSVPGKVAVVWWKVQSSQCVVQIWGPSFPVAPNPRDAFPTHDALFQFPQTQVWLLKSDGTVITQTRKPDRAGFYFSAGSGNEIVDYVFPASARTKAVSVVIKVNDQFLVEPLTPDAN